MIALRSVRRLMIFFVVCSFFLPTIISPQPLSTISAQTACDPRPPTPLELAYFSQFVYQDDAGSSILSGSEDLPGLEESEWQILSFEDQMEGIGYFGAVYTNDVRCQVVIAHRGADAWSQYVESDTLTAIAPDMAVVLDDIPEQFREGALPFSEQVETLLNAQGKTVDDGWIITQTGHSLGAALAEISAAHFPDTNAITFESPGTLPVITSEYGEDVIENLHIVTYVGPPSLVNTAYPHIGDVFLVDPAWRAFSDEPPFRIHESIVEPAERLVSSVLSYLIYTSESNSLNRIIAQFDTTTGAPRVPIPVKSWWPHGILNGVWYFLFTPTVLQAEPMKEFLVMAALADEDGGYGEIVSQMADAGMSLASVNLFDLNGLIVLNTCGFDQACIEAIVNACVTPAINAYELACMQRVIEGEDVTAIDVVDVIDEPDTDSDDTDAEDTEDDTDPDSDLSPSDIDSEDADSDDTEDTIDTNDEAPDTDIDTDDSEDTIVVDEPEPENMLDIVFVIDTTSSMADDISAVKAQAVNIINRVAESGTSWRIGIVTFRDHPIAPYGDPTDYSSRVDLDFTDDRNSIVNTVNLIAVDGGGDEPEAVYDGLMTAIDFSWRDGAKKAIILMGDAPPHDPEPRTDFTLAQVLRAAFEVDPVNIYAILIENSPTTRIAFQSLADGSSGQLVNASSASDVVDAILETITSITENPELVSVLTVGSNAVVNISDEQYGLRLGPGTEYSLSENLLPNTPVEIIGDPVFSGVYIWWPIRSLTSGYEGWTVQAVNGEVTLVPAEGTTPPASEVGNCAVSASNTVNRRQYPTTDSAVTQQLPARTEVAAEGYNWGGDQFIWYYLEDGSWIRSDIITTSGDCDNLPQVRPWLNDYPTPVGFEAPGIRTSAPPNSGVLNGGIGLSNGAVQNNGDMQVEGYCNRLGYGITENQVDWFCTIDDGTPAFTLGARDFDAICRETYDNPRAVAIQDGSGTAWAYRWRCHEVR